MNYSTGANKSPFDLRTFTYVPDKANIVGGTKWEPASIEDQKRVGICTGISASMRARKHFGIDFSDDFQYLMQKRSENNWDEGSSISSALNIGKNVGFLPQSEWTFTTLEDRNLPYAQYIEKLKAVPESEIIRLSAIASKYKIKAYASIPVTRDNIANAIDEQGALPSRFVIGEEWWTAPIEPLRPPKTVISGHAINITNYNGDSMRLANSWGIDWADKGTAYFLFSQYRPTEAWGVWFSDVPQVIIEQIESRATIVGKILDLLQQIILLVTKLK